jgi:hypothetical protein
MTATYDNYCHALAQLRDLPSRTAADLDHSRETHARADAMAYDSISAAEATASETLRVVEAQLAAARTALEPLGKSNLIPPRIRPSGGAGTATRDEIRRVQHSLAAAVNQVRQVAQSEIERIESDRRRLAREAAERHSAAAARRKRLIRAGVAAAAVVVVLVVILAISL